MKGIMLIAGLIIALGAGTCASMGGKDVVLIPAKGNEPAMVEHVEPAARYVFGLVALGGLAMTGYAMWSSRSRKQG